MDNSSFSDLFNVSFSPSFSRRRPVSALPPPTHHFGRAGLWNKRCASTHSTRNENRGSKLLKFIGEMIVNGPDPSLGATGSPPSIVDPMIPNLRPMDSEFLGPRALLH